MKYLLFFILPLSLIGGTYMVPSIPVEKVTIKSEIEGKVILSMNDREQKFIKNTIVVKIDDELERSQIKYYQKQIGLLKQIVSLKKINASNKEKVTRLSQYDKNIENIRYLESAKELASVERTIAQIKLNQDKKVFRVKNRYLQRLHVKKNERIQIGENIMTIYDTSSIKLIAYMPKNEIKALKAGKILFNGKKSNFELYSIDKITDDIHLTSHRVEFRKNLGSNSDYIFGELIKIEVVNE